MITQFTRTLKREMRARLGALRAVAFKTWARKPKQKEEKMPKAVYRSGDKSYVIRPEDRIHLARMIIGEAGQNPSDESIQALLWAIMNRFMLVPAQRERSTLEDMLLAFSQPINPRWDGIPDNQSGQDFCCPGGAYYGKEDCSPERLARRQRITSITWAKVPARIKDFIYRFEGGNVPYPAKASNQKITNWASYPGVADKFPWGVSIGDNWFFEDKQAMDLAVAAITGTSTLGKVLGFLAVGGVATAVGYYLGERL